jgi:hypothetical protein
LPSGDAEDVLDRKAGAGFSTAPPFGLIPVPMSLHHDVLRQLREQATGTTAAEPAPTLQQSLRLLAKWRSVLIQNTLLQHEGTVVRQGPLRGMEFLRQSSEGCHVPKLLGCYEQPLQPYLEEAMSASYATILNIGCAEGYYAVGFARRLPDARIWAFDLDANARAVCQSLAEKNGVASRVTIGGLFRPADFRDYAHGRTLVLCDIEGAERALLDPDQAPELRGLDLIVESHECLDAGITQELIRRFSPTHAVTLVSDDGQRHLEKPPAWFLNLAHLDQLLATWEWRSGPTPWLVMRAR